MTSSFQGGIAKSFCQEKAESQMSAAPAEFVTALAYGSVRLPTPPITKKYFWCGWAPGTSADQTPPGSLARGVAVSLSPLKSPATLTLGANGAQTRKVTPPAYGIAP